jgi:hypothetical protein
MSYILHLDSEADGLRFGSRPEDFTLENLNLNLDLSKNYEIALLSASIWYSWFNISHSQYQNAIWRYSVDMGATWLTHSIPDGLYGIDSLNEYFADTIRNDGNNPDYLRLSANYSTFRCVVKVSAGYQLDLQSSQSKLHELLGFNSQVVTLQTQGQNNVNITNNINSLSIHCSVVDSNSSFLNNQPTDAIYSFMPRSGPSTLLDVRPLHLIYVPITTKNLTSIRMSVTNQLNEIINLNGEHTSFVLHIREKSL